MSRLSIRTARPRRRPARRRRDQSPPRAVAGFTLLELMVVLAVLIVALLIAYPALRQMLQRSQLDTATQQVANAFYAARYQAIRQGVEARVVIAFDDQTLTTLLDRSKDGSFGSRVALLRIEPQVALQGPDDEAPYGDEAVDGFERDDDGAVVVFRPDGTVAAEGALRLTGTDGKVVEIRVAPAASARVAVRTWNALPGKWVENGR